jgi:hypothetical protein
MCRLVIYLILYITAIDSYAQTYLLLKNGNKIELDGQGTLRKQRQTSVKLKDDKIVFKTKEGGKQSFAPEEVLGYTSVNLEETYYLKKDKEDYHYVELIMPGKINVFKREEVSYSTMPSVMPGGPGMMTPKTKVTYFMEKDGLSGEMPNAVFFGSAPEKRKEFLKPYFSDREEILRNIQDEDASFKEKSILNLIRQYNLMEYDSSNDSKKSMSTAFFYVNGSPAKPMKLKVNGATDYDVNTENFFAVKLANNQQNKICINSYCEILEGSLYYIKYYEIHVNQSVTKIDIRASTSKEARNYFAQQIHRK